MSPLVRFEITAVTAPFVLRRQVVTKPDSWMESPSNR